MKNKERFWIYLSIGISLLFYGCEKEPETVTDIDGNEYSTVTIGTQVWMGENLKTTKFRDGTDIPYIPNEDEWRALSTPGYCYYDNSWSDALVYGALYNWHTVNTGNLCPTGWHVPSDEEWTTLITYLGGDTLVGGKLKDTGTTFWESPNEGATNETGFSALPGGYRSSSGSFHGIRVGSDFWSSSVYIWDEVIFIGLYNITSNPFKSHADKPAGMSVRCICD